MRLARQDMVLRITGVLPLLMHSGRLADPLDEHAVALRRVTSKRNKVDEDHARIARLEWRGGLWLAGGLPCVPAEAIESALATAARTRRLGGVVRSAVVVRESPALRYDGPADMEALYETPGFVHRCGVRVNARRTMRTRPRFDPWSLDATLSFMPSAIDGATLLEIAEIAGQFVGLGDHRPTFGRFLVERIG